MPQFSHAKHAYYSEELKSWVRMEREVDGEWSHTSGFETKDKALGHIQKFDRNKMPSFLTEET